MEQNEFNKMLRQALQSEGIQLELLKAVAQGLSSHHYTTLDPKKRIAAAIADELGLNKS